MLSPFSDPSPSTSVALLGHVGGLAPVLFFFVVGLGVGLRPTGRGGKGWGFAAKAGLLLLADLDFFLFIGVAMLLLEPIARLRRGVPVALAVAAVVVGARFLVGPLARTYAEHRPWVAILLGTGGGFGYPAGPWMAYPMLGFALGRFAGPRASAITADPRLPFRVALLAIPPALFAVFLLSRGAQLQRYGSMNLAYFAYSLAALPLAMAACLAATRWLPSATALALEGIRSFAVVPIHYLLIAVFVGLLGPPPGIGGVLTVVALVAPASFLASRSVASLANFLAGPGPRRACWVAAIALASLYHLVPGRPAGEGVAASALRATYLLALCLPLAAPARTRRPESAFPMGWSQADAIRA